MDPTLKAVAASRGDEQVLAEGSTANTGALRAGG